jgi:hypothetical protein
METTRTYWLQEIVSHLKMAQHDVVFLGYELLNMQHDCVRGPIHIQNPWL